MSAERSIDKRVGGGLGLTGHELLNPPKPLSVVVLNDLDNTTFNTGVCGVNIFKKLLVEELGQDVDLNFEADHAYKWDQLSDWAINRGVSESRAGELEGMVWGDVSFYQMIEPLAGASELIDWLVNNEIDLRFHTSRPAQRRAATYRNIKEHFPEIYSPFKIDIRLSDDEDRSFFKPKNAIRRANEYGRVVFVDDNPDDVEMMLRATKSLEVYGILVSFRGVAVNDYLLYHDRLIIISGDFIDRGLWGVYEYLTGKA